jgi:hypothetical protein
VAALAVACVVGSTPIVARNASAAGKPDPSPAGVAFVSSYNQRADFTAGASGVERNWAMRPRYPA